MKAILLPLLTVSIAVLACSNEPNSQAQVNTETAQLTAVQEQTPPSPSAESTTNLPDPNFSNDLVNAKLKEGIELLESFKKALDEDRTEEAMQIYKTSIRWSGQAGPMVNRLEGEEKQSFRNYLNKLTMEFAKRAPELTTQMGN